MKIIKIFSENPEKSVWLLNEFNYNSTSLINLLSKLLFVLNETKIG